MMNDWEFVDPTISLNLLDNLCWYSICNHEICSNVLAFKTEVNSQGASGE